MQHSSKASDALPNTVCTHQSCTVNAEGGLDVVGLHKRVDETHLTVEQGTRFGEVIDHLLPADLPVPMETAFSDCFSWPALHCHLHLYIYQDLIFKLMNDKFLKAFSNLLLCVCTDGPKHDHHPNVKQINFETTSLAILEISLEMSAMNAEYELTI